MSRKLLIVDDDPHIRRLVSLYLRGSAYEIFEAATGEEAVSLVDHHQFDVILLDLILPYSGGFRLCQRFKAKKSGKVPYIVIITGDDSPETRETANDCGADEFLAKPFSGEQVRDLVDKVAG